jgi:hypothetical protein
MKNVLLILIFGMLSLSTAASSWYPDLCGRGTSEWSCTQPSNLYIKNLSGGTETEFWFYVSGPDGEAYCHYITTTAACGKIAYANALTALSSNKMIKIHLISGNFTANGVLDIDGITLLDK